MTTLRYVPVWLTGGAAVSVAYFTTSFTHNGWIISKYLTKTCVYARWYIIDGLEMRALNE